MKISSCDEGPAPVEYLDSQLMSPKEKPARQVIGGCIRLLRLQAGMTLERLATKAHVSYQYLSGVETGKENFSINVLEKLAKALEFPVAALIEAAYSVDGSSRVPVIDERDLRAQVPLPPGLGPDMVVEALNRAQLTHHRINHFLRAVVGRPATGLWTHGLATEVLCAALARCTPYSHGPADGRSNRLVRSGRGHEGEFLIVEARPAADPGVISNSGARGWRLVALYESDRHGDLRFVHVMAAELSGHRDAEPHWQALIGHATAGTAERYAVTPRGFTRLLDGSIFFARPLPSDLSSLEERRPGETAPPWSIFADDQREPATAD